MRKYVTNVPWGLLFLTTVMRSYPHPVLPPVLLMKTLLEYLLTFGLHLLVMIHKALVVWLNYSMTKWIAIYLTTHGIPPLVGTDTTLVGSYRGM